MEVWELKRIFLPIRRRMEKKKEKKRKKRFMYEVLYQVEPTRCSCPEDY